jgi:hypothetical protein
LAIKRNCATKARLCAELALAKAEKARPAS